MTTRHGGAIRPVVRAVRFALAHVPGLVFAGSKPRRVFAADAPELRAEARRHLRSYASAVAYPPHQVLLGALPPEALRAIPRPWHQHPVAAAAACGPAGSLIDEDTFYAWLGRADAANLVHFSERFAASLQDGNGGEIAASTSGQMVRAMRERGEPLYRSGEEAPIGVVVPAHDQDEALSAAIL